MQERSEAERRAIWPCLNVATWRRERSDRAHTTNLKHFFRTCATQIYFRTCATQIYFRTCATQSYFRTCELPPSLPDISFTLLSVKVSFL